MSVKAIAPAPDLAPVLFRIASWPIDTVNALRSEAFTSEVDRALTREELIRARSEHLSAALYALIPGLEVEGRRTALRVRRALHRNVEPVDSTHIAALAAQPVIGKLLLADDEERRGLQKDLQRLRGQYAATLQVELDALSTIVDDISFRRAIAVASASTSEALEKFLGHRGVPEGWRLRATLLNYVLRATGRATPNGLWSGIAMESKCVADAPVAFQETCNLIFAKPDLNVFSELLDLAASPQTYRKCVLLRWNPTMTALNNGRYAYAQSSASGWGCRYTTDDDAIAQLKEVLRNGDEAEFEELSAGSGLSSAVLERLYTTGVLCAAIDRPGVYEDADGALYALMQCLTEAERPHWQKTVSGLRDICTSLMACGSDLDITQLREALCHSRGLVNALRIRYGAVPLPSHRNVLVFDQIAPFEIQLSREVKNRVAEALRSYWDFDRGGVGELLARSARISQVADTSVDIALALAGISVERTRVDTTCTVPGTRATSGSWEEVGRSVFPRNELADDFHDLMHEWTADLADSWAKPAHEIKLASASRRLPMPPGSALLVPSFGPQGLCLRIGSMAPDWNAFYGRFHYLFAARGNFHFRNWITQARKFVEAKDIRLADIAIRGNHDRNTALRPRLGSRILDPWSSQLSDLTADVTRESGVRLRDQESRHVSPVLHSAVETSTADPWSKWFADVEANKGRTSLLAPVPPLARELNEWKHCPRLTMDSTTVIGPERWWCPSEITAQLGQNEGFDRYLTWRRWAHRMNLPARTYARYGTNETETLLLADSVLSIEVLGRALSQTDSPLRLQEMFFGEAGLWLEDSKGRKYLAEMAVAWRGDDEFWRSQSANRVSDGETFIEIDK